MPRYSFKVVKNPAVSVYFLPFERDFLLRWARLRGETLSASVRQLVRRELRAIPDYERVAKDWALRLD